MVTVIIPSYNVEQWLPNAIQSVIDQTVRDWELVIVDDGSTDSTGAIADKAAANDPRIKAIHTPNRGAASARVAGLGHATGSYVTFLDADDSITADALEWMTRYVTDDVAVVVGGLRRCTDRGSYAARGEYSGVISVGEYVEGLLKGDFSTSMCAKLFRRQDLLEINEVIDSEIVLSEDMLMLVASLRSTSHLYVDTGRQIYNYSYRHDSAVSSATMSFRGWVKLISGLRRFVDDNETFFLYRLRRLYDCCITRGAMFSRYHPEVRRLISDSHKYLLESQDRRIVMMLRSRLVRRLVARRHRRVLPDSGVIISVIMPAYNEPYLIERAIRSVLRQRFRDWELIVVDDCSLDSTPDVVRAIAAVDNRVRLLRSSSNQGQGASRLQGIAAARGEYVAFIDQDDLMAPDALGSMWAKAQDSGADIVVMGSCRVSRGGWLKVPLFRPSRFFTKPLYSTRELLPHLLRRSGFPCTQWDRLYRRSIINLAEHSKEPVGEDLVFNLLTMLHSGRLAWVDYQGYRWRAGGQSGVPYPQRWENNLATYARVLELLKERHIDQDPTLRLNLDQGLVNDFLDKIALALHQKWRKGLRRFVEDALATPLLLDAMRNTGFAVNVDSALEAGRRWRREHKLYYWAVYMLNRL